MPAQPLYPTYHVHKGGAYQGLSDPRWKWWKAIAKEDPSFQWQMPVRFYGKVVSGDRLPVADADVRYGWNETIGSHELLDKSNAGGLFPLIGISQEMPEAALNTPLFASRIITNRREQRVIFRLEKRMDAEPLVVDSAFKHALLRTRHLILRPETRRA